MGLESILTESHGHLGGIGRGKWRQWLPVALLPGDQAVPTDRGSPGAVPPQPPTGSQAAW